MNILTEISQNILSYDKQLSQLFCYRAHNCLHHLTNQTESSVLSCHTIAKQSSLKNLFKISLVHVFNYIYTIPWYVLQADGNYMTIQALLPPSTFSPLLFVLTIDPELPVPDPAPFCSCISCGHEKEIIINVVITQF